MFILQLIILLVVVFAGLIFFMIAISSKNTQTAVSRLDAVYQDLLQKQKEVNAKIEEGEKEYQEKKELAQKEAEKYKADAMEEMRAKKDEIIKQAKSQADEITGRAKEGADALAKQVTLDAQLKVVDTAADILMSAIDAKSAPRFHSMILDDFLNKAKDFDLTKVSPHIDTVTIKTPYPLSDQEKAKINSLISSKINRTLKIDEIEERSLIAGILMEFGTLLVDGSVASAIREAQEQLKEKMRMGS